ncbi:MAG: OmpA family protein [Planctomycetota bacterium]|nr:OmpA family protein [Planctomycetota bacterium]
MRITSLLALSPLAALPFALAACVPQEKYDELRTAYRSQEQQLGAQGEELQTARANESRLRTQLAQAAADLERLDSLGSGVGQDMETLMGELEALRGRVSALDFGALSPEVNTALAALAAQYPDILSFNAKLGMLQFASDFTFDLGSVELKPEAKSLLRKLAPVLNSGDAANLEIVVVGHTDNSPIKRAATRQAHPTNVHLSAHRAISVRDALVGDGLTPNRFQIAGYGEFRPAVPNGPKGTAGNRRVEIFLRPMPMVIEAVIVEETVTTTPAPVADDEPTK